MKQLSVLTLVACCAMMMVSVSCGKRETLSPSKKIVTWYIYKDGSSFRDIEPVKEIIASLSVFGKPDKAFIDECHTNNIEVYHAVSGNEASIDTPEKIKALVDGYVQICRSEGYDGIDLDFENLNPGVQDIYSKFLKAAAEKLHAAGKKLSHCVGFYPALYKAGKPEIFYDPGVLAATCDLVRVMCYDMYFSPGKGNPELLNRDDCQGIGATSTYPWTKDAMLFWIKYIGKDRLVMALPAYSNDYTVSGDIRGRQIYRSVPDSVAGVLPTPTWLWYDRQNVYLYDDINGTPHIFYASDARSTEALLELADELDIRNIGFWHFGSVTPEMWNVVKRAVLE
jgi:spore germination protein YaaH